jgi:hypothetical protein
MGGGAFCREIKGLDFVACSVSWDLYVLDILPWDDGSAPVAERATGPVLWQFRVIAVS